MQNFALNKKVLEKCNNPSNLTDGNSTVYDGRHGYTHGEYPCYFTIDLENEFDIGDIRFLLYDEDNRNYCYRLLTSLDNKNWQVHFDSGQDGYRGWQVFHFTKKIKVRYIRIHGIWNSANKAFHIVQVEAYDDPPKLDNPNVNEWTISTEEKEFILEQGDGMPLTARLLSLVEKLEELPEKYPGLDKGYFNEIVNELKVRIVSVNKIEKSLDAIRNEIVNPVNTELKRSNRIGRLSIGLGILGGLVGIFSILNAIFHWII